MVSNTRIRMLNKVAVPFTVCGVALAVVGLVLHNAYRRPAQIVCDQGGGCGVAVPVGLIAGDVLLVVGIIVTLAGIFNLARNAYIKSRARPSTVGPASQAGSLVARTGRLPNRPGTAPLSRSPAAAPASNPKLVCGSCRSGAVAGQAVGERCYSCGGTFVLR